MAHEFSYVAYHSLDELLGFLSANAGNATVFAGGTDLFVNMRAGLARPRFVADLKTIPELRDLHFDEADGLSIGASVTVNELIEHSVVRERYSILATAGHELGTFQLRNRATVAGNIVTASPCGDLSSPLLCLGAAVELRSVHATRRMPLAEFITGVKKTRIAADEIVSRIIVPVDLIDARGGYRKLKRIKGHDLGLVAVALIKAGQTMRVAVTSAAPTPVLLPALSVDTPADEVVRAAREAISPIDDVRCTAEYRSFMAGVYVRRLMQEVPA